MAESLTTHQSAGERSRQTILETAARLATVEGLDGLTIGKLAEAVGMSKSGLYAHFKSKEDLQLATIAMAREIFDREVTDPGQSAAPGATRVLALCDAFLAHVEDGVYPGGCFFVAAAAEMNARPGEIRDHIAQFVAEWLGAIATAVEQARELGEIEPQVEPGQLAFEINALLSAANLAYPLFGDPTVLHVARKAIAERLDTPADEATRGPIS
ncbi:MAG TPA: TetR/AcrR family transcriptional regulator [Solirubrobacteraceae bacterium]|jgi:AcrR family transcriptional regulator|nr:TetR/AcrR family transcriptional regulator [Solirubrobacteraceae bacterium]